MLSECHSRIYGLSMSSWRLQISAELEALFADYLLNFGSIGGSSSDQLLKRARRIGPQDFT